MKHLKFDLLLHCLMTGIPQHMDTCSWGQIVLKAFTPGFSFQLLGSDFQERSTAPEDMSQTPALPLSLCSSPAPQPLLLHCSLNTRREHSRAAHLDLEPNHSTWCSPHRSHLFHSFPPLSHLDRKHTNSSKDSTPRQQLPQQLPTVNNSVFCTCYTNGEYLNKTVLLLHWPSVWQKGWFAVSWQIMWQHSCLGIIAVTASVA